MSTLAELLAQRDELEAKIQATFQTERADAIAEVKALMQENGLTLSDIGGGGGKVRAKAKAATEATTKPKTKVQAKYRDGGGNSWSGRGLQPRWLKAALVAGKKIEDFAV